MMTHPLPPDDLKNHDLYDDFECPLPPQNDKIEVKAPSTQDWVDFWENSKDV